MSGFLAFDRRFRKVSRRLNYPVDLLSDRIQQSRVFTFVYTRDEHAIANTHTHTHTHTAKFLLESSLQGKSKMVLLIPAFQQPAMLGNTLWLNAQKLGVGGHSNLCVQNQNCLDCCFLHRMANENQNARTTDPQLYLRTPLIESFPMSRLAGCRVHLKLENLQPSSSFKIRGIGHHIKHVRSCCVCVCGGGSAILAGFWSTCMQSGVKPFNPEVVLSTEWCLIDLAQSIVRVQPKQ